MSHEGGAKLTIAAQGANGLNKRMGEMNLGSLLWATGYATIIGSMAHAECDPSSFSPDQVSAEMELYREVLRTQPTQDRLNDTIEALNCFSMNGQTPATLLLASLHLNSDLIPADEEKGVELLKIAGEQGNSEEQNQIASYFLYGQFETFRFQPDIEVAVDLYSRAALSGQPDAQTTLCGVFRTDFWGRQDNNAAVWFCRLAIDSGDVLALTALADLLMSDGSYPQDKQEAVELYRRSAMLGTNIGAMGLGRAYEMGQGVLQDYLLAHAWYNVAAARSAGERQLLAMESRQRIAAFLTSEQVIEAQGIASELTVEFSGEP